MLWLHAVTDKMQLPLGFQLAIGLETPIQTELMVTVLIDYWCRD